MFLQLVVLFQSTSLFQSCQPNKCFSTTCYILPPSPPMYPPLPPPRPYAMAPSIMPPPPPPPMFPPMPPMLPPMLPRMPSSHQSSTIVSSETPYVAPMEPSLSQLNSYAPSATASSRWDRQEPEYKHIDEEAVEAVVAPDVVVADTVDEKSSSQEKVEKVHENERLARMDLKFAEPEATLFDNGTVTFHAWFF